MVESRERFWRFATVYFVMIAMISGCASDAEQTGQAGLKGNTAFGVVSVGDLIGTADDVVDRARKQELSNLRSVADDLADDLVFVHEARRLELDQIYDVRASVEQLLVQRLLLDLEVPTEPDAIAHKEVTQAYENYNEQFVIPERRTIWHVVARDPGDEAKRYIESLLSKMRSARDPSAVLENAEAPSSASFEVKFERLPPMAENSPFAEKFKKAVFSKKGTGMVDEAIKTNFGWHAIVVKDTQPAVVQELDTVQGAIRKKLSFDARKEGLDELFSHLRTTIEVFRNEKAITQALSLDLSK